MVITIHTLSWLCLSLEISCLNYSNLNKTLRYLITLLLRVLLLASTGLTLKHSSHTSLLFVVNLRLPKVSGCIHKMLLVQTLESLILKVTWVLILIRSCLVATGLVTSLKVLSGWLVSLLGTLLTAMTLSSGLHSLKIPTTVLLSSSW